ncbi:MAG: group 1 truncated hemoglobin [Verrucomicrobia bacterium]|nr:group 1 truncated hemoglobin [Verrucomicrobiota bacterium]
MTGKAINPECTFDFEEVTYAFCSGKCRGEFKGKVTDSLYSQLGGKAAIDAAVDLFYTKVLADKRVNFFFEDTNMKRQHNKQKQFLSAALGSPVPYEGMDMRKGHANMDLKEEHFNAIAENLQATLEELKIKPELIAKVMAVVATTKDDVLNRPKSK